MKHATDSGNFLATIRNRHANASISGIKTLIEGDDPGGRRFLRSPALFRPADDRPGRQHGGLPGSVAT